ncbi:M48 family metalloprotease [candidate division KSB1 bacterium]|nr:M48 family metalloprotease [candidate division KSB1 bacterium]
MNAKILSSTRDILSFLFVMQFLTSCAVNPVTGNKGISLLSYNDENRLGRQADRQIVAQYGLYNDDPEITEYVNELGEQIAHVSHRPFLDFHIRVMDMPEVNAFALPGGYIYVTRGLLAYMNSEAELAGVLGHESGHVTARHAADQYTKSQLGQMSFGVASIFFPPSILFGNAAQVGVGLLFLRFSRDHERQADSVGVEYASRIGYDATNMADFFNTLERLQKQRGQASLGWFSTHPDPGDRKVAVQRMANWWQREKLPPYEFKTGRDRYLDMIDGLVFGEEPRKGFVENGYFYHPILDFQLPIPVGWRLANTPQQVQIVNNNRTAFIELTLSEQPNARRAAEKFQEDADAEVIYSDRTKINGYTTEIRESEITRRTQTRQRRRSARTSFQEIETFKVLSYFIEKDGRVFVFQGLSRRRDYDKYASAFKRTMNNFDRLRNQDAKNIKPTRLKVVEVTESSTLKDFLAGYRNDELSDKDMAILNGMKLTDRVSPGDRIKILTRHAEELADL